MEGRWWGLQGVTGIPAVLFSFPPDDSIYLFTIIIIVVVVILIFSLFGKRSGSWSRE